LCQPISNHQSCQLLSSNCSCFNISTFSVFIFVYYMLFNFQFRSRNRQGAQVQFKASSTTIYFILFFNNETFLSPPDEIWDRYRTDDWKTIKVLFLSFFSHSDGKQKFLLIIIIVLIVDDCHQKKLFLRKKVKEI
jgi:hypothetical protein